MSDPGKRQTKIADHEFSSGVGVDFGGGVECVERAGGIDDGRAGIDGNRHAQHFGDLFPGRAPFPGSRSMHRDAAVAAQGDSDRKRYEFASLFIEVTGLLAGPAQGGVALDDIGVELAKGADPGDKLLPICIPIQHMHDAFLRCDVKRKFSAPRWARPRYYPERVEWIGLPMTSSGKAADRALPSSRRSPAVAR